MINCKNLANRCIAIIRLTRPINCFSAMISTIIGGLFVTRVVNNDLLLAALIAAMITASGNVLNDYFDIEIDRINKPERMLPAGRVTVGSALWIGLLIDSTAVVLGFFLGIKLGVFSLVMAICAFVYSWKLKKSYLTGNILVSLMSGLIFIFGSLVFNKVGHAWIPGLMVFLFMLDREILKTVEDIKGDRLYGAKTLAVQKGQPIALRIFMVFALLAAFSVPLPWIMKDVSLIYLILTIPLVSVVLILITFMVMQPPSLALIKQILKVMKGTWFIWVLSTFVGVLLQPI